MFGTANVKKSNNKKQESYHRHKNAEQEKELEKIKDLLGDTRHNLVAIANSEDAQEWKYLRPPCVRTMTSLIGDRKNDESIVDEHSDKDFVWIPDEKDAFALVEVLSKDEKAFWVTTRKGDVRTNYYETYIVLLILEHIIIISALVFGCCFFTFYFLTFIFWFKFFFLF